MSKIYTSADQLIGHTPLLELAHIEAQENLPAKILAKLEEVTGEGIVLSYEEKQAIEGKKRKQLVKVVKRYAFSEVKYTKEYLDFK